MKKLGRCGRRRRSKDRKRICYGISQAHLPEYVSLFQWIKRSVGHSQWKADSWHCLEPALFTDTGRGLKATRNIYPGETIISIPVQLLITTSTVFDSDIGSVIQNEKKQFTPQQLLTIYLVIERWRGDKSQWLPYINTLPCVYSTPLSFSEMEIELLTPHVKNSATLIRERYSKAFQRIKQFIRNCASSLEHMFTEPNVRWAWATLNTRSVYLQTSPHPLLILDPEESNVALAPFLDLLNHKDSSKMSAGINSKSKRYDIVTQDTYKMNEEVFICYGAHDNHKLLVNYGFTLPTNIYNSYTFTLDEILACIQDEIQHVDKKLAMIKEAELDKDILCTIYGVSWSLMAALKIAVLSWEQLPKWKLVCQGIILSQDNEDLAHKMASRLLESSLQKANKHLEHLEMQQLTHLDLVRRLWLDDVKILESSLYCLVKCQLN